MIDTYTVSTPVGACRTCGEDLAIRQTRIKLNSQTPVGENDVVDSDPTRRHVRTDRVACDLLDQVIPVIEPSADPDAPDALWMVASANEAPGAYWPVRRQHYRSTSLWRCPCPAGRAMAEAPANERIACRHLKAVAAFENKRLARRVSPVNVSAMVD